MDKKRFLVVLLALMASVSLLFATGQKDTSSIEEPPVKVTTTIGNVRYRNDYPDNPVAKDILEKINVVVEVVSATGDEMAVMRASGDLPDIFITQASERGELISSGFVLELDDLLKENGADILKEAALAIEFLKIHLSEGTGKIWFLPGAGGYDPTFWYGEGSNISPHMRWDYYKELGYPEMKSMDDFLDVVEQMVKKHPRTEDGKRVYGVPSWSDWGLWPYTIQLAGVYGFFPTDTKAKEADVKTNKLYDAYGNPDSSLWKTVDFYYQQNRRGIFDTDSLVGKWGDIQSKSANGQYVATFFRSLVDPGHNLLAPEGKGYIHIPMDGIGQWGGHDGRYGSNNCRWVAAKAERPDKVVEFLNYCYSVDGAMTLWNGVEGVQWDVVDGKSEADA